MIRFNPPKNEMVKNHYLDLGFSQDDDFWKLELNNYQQKTTHIVKK